uniref:Uncharacterized protein n=1 Tax=Arundo donax TaxID=35708 RepID=A0A0A9CGD7_ARUDO
MWYGGCSEGGLKICSRLGQDSAVYTTSAGSGHVPRAHN